MNQIQKPKVLFATNNPGKLAEGQLLASQFGITLISPKDLGIDLDVDETGDSYKANALLKAQSFANAIKDPDIYVVADDSGVEIVALNNEPGIHTRRWKGYPMTDQEILDYALERLQGKKGKERAANLVSMVCVVRQGHKPLFFDGIMHAQITESPVKAAIIEGFPFRSVLYLQEIDKMVYDIHGVKLHDRDGFMTHREKSLQKAFDHIANETNKIKSKKSDEIQKQG